MATSGERVTYAEIERRSNHFLRASGLRRLDHYAIFTGNNARYIECCCAGESSGSLLHLRQLVSDAGRDGLHPRQQRVEGADHVDG
jgi:hypothetical protein